MRPDPARVHLARDSRLARLGLSLVGVGLRCRCAGAEPSGPLGRNEAWPALGSSPLWRGRLIESLQRKRELGESPCQANAYLFTNSSVRSALSAIRPGKYSATSSTSAIVACSTPWYAIVRARTRIAFEHVE